jgi:hypothetical protein
MKTCSIDRNVSVGPSACCNYSTTGWILIKFDIKAFTRSCMTIPVLIKTDAIVFIISVWNTNKLSETQDAKNA